MKVALVGLTQSGKSTLVSAVSGRMASVNTAAQVTTTAVPVPDVRMDWLTELYQPKKTVHATIDCIDVPGFDFTENSGRAAAKRVIDQVRAVDMFVLVVRAFISDSVTSYRGSVDARRDVIELLSEFLLADLEMVTTRVERLTVQATKPSKTQAQDKEELALYQKLQGVLEESKPVRTVVHTERDYELVSALGLLTLRPIMVVINVSEDKLDEKLDLSGVVDESVPIVALSARVEQELSTLDAPSRKEFMADLGITESAASRFVNSCYTAMGLIGFLTVGPDEVRAWPLRKGAPALEAAGKIHSDIKRGFIRAETISYDDLKTLGSEKAVKAAGKMRLEGKTYIVQDGDIINFRFNV